MPYIDPEKFELSKRGDKLFKHFLESIERSMSKSADLKSLISVLALIISVYPRIVMVLTKTQYQKLSSEANNASSNLQPEESKNLTQDAVTTTSFLNSLLKAIMNSYDQVLFEILCNSLINPQMQSELVLYNGEVISTPTYHRHLLVEWLIECFENLSSSDSSNYSDKSLNILLPAIKIIFRDTHLLTPIDIELYYKVIDRFLDMHILSIERIESSRSREFQSLLSDVACCLEPLRDIQLTTVISEVLNLNPRELLFNFNFVLVKKFQDFFYHNITSKLFLSSSVEEPIKIAEETKFDSVSDYTNRTERKLMTDISPSSMSAYQLSELLVETKLINGYLLNEKIKLKSGINLYDREFQFLLSRLPTSTIRLQSTRYIIF